MTSLPRNIGQPCERNRGTQITKDFTFL